LTLFPHIKVRNMNPNPLLFRMEKEGDVTRQEEKGNLVRRFPAGDFARRRYRGEIIMLRACAIIFIALLLIFFPLVPVWNSLMLVVLLGLIILGSEWLNHLNCRTHGESNVFTGGVEIFTLSCLFTLFRKKSEYISAPDIERIEVLSQKLDSTKSWIESKDVDIPRGLAIITRDQKVRQLLDRPSDEVVECVNLMGRLWGVKSGLDVTSRGEEGEIALAVLNDYDPKKFTISFCVFLSAVLFILAYEVFDTANALSESRDVIGAGILGIMIGTFFGTLFFIPYLIWMYYRGHPTSFLFDDSGFAMTFRLGRPKRAKWSDIVAFAVPSWEEVRKSKERRGGLWLERKLGIWVIPLSPNASHSIKAAYVKRIGKSPPAFDENKNKRLVDHELKFGLVFILLWFFLAGACIALVFIFLY